ncbi:MAG: hypothetical protein ACI4QC_08735, partial [Thermoguttaceae bacterium]
MKSRRRRKQSAERYSFGGFGADQFDLCAASRREPEVSSGWTLPVVERGRGPTHCGGVCAKRL